MQPFIFQLLGEKYFWLMLLLMLFWYQLLTISMLHHVKLNKTKFDMFFFRIPKRIRLNVLRQEKIRGLLRLGSREDPPLLTLSYMIFPFLLCPFFYLFFHLFYCSMWFVVVREQCPWKDMALISFIVVQERYPWCDMRLMVPVKVYITKWQRDISIYLWSWA